MVTVSDKQQEWTLVPYSEETGSPNELLDDGSKAETDCHDLKDAYYVPQGRPVSLRTEIISEIGESAYVYLHTVPPELLKDVTITSQKSGCSDPKSIDIPVIAASENQNGTRLEITWTFVIILSREKDLFRLMNNG
ncbi:hypothetical protein DFQ28_000445 [Apophysomyces sp. BC1034]|nr:hypothetical protein DFQ30_000451 [Apophysomyces sp. BC1015]KAG0178090.1 hypothetical protein DFQ29_003968 [Apophysomyces sp. BC1021]KAG0191328.1 hypothetical protein DFQ28_000445 [Apophysomyces sp. BC1034]